VDRGGAGVQQQRRRQTTATATTLHSGLFFKDYGLSEW
jgi:hypothetical protein